jgi:3-phosphoshikimate 1-carboxyvinyltransferase
LKALVRAPASLAGEIHVPGDKSISHRALILNSVATGTAHITGLSPGDDVASTASCLRALGVDIDDHLIHGRGLAGLKEPAGPLDCGNSGTTMRLLAGLLAGQPFPVTLVGDASLSRRPMERIAAPLRLMGAAAETEPLRVGGGDALRGIDYLMPVPSAQVKSAILLAALAAVGTTRVTEPVATRDHTERMLVAMGAPLVRNGLTAEVGGPVIALSPLDVAVPGDISAAAFWLVAAALHPKGMVELPRVGINPTRSAVLDVLTDLGLTVARHNERTEGAEQVADLRLGHSPPQRPLRIDGAGVVELIDELPVLAVAAAYLPGTSRITGAGELRVKECDRISAMTAGLSAMGADVTELDDGWEIRGPRFLEGARVSSFGDHRVAMALAVAGLLADGTTEIEDADCVDISYPAFWDHLEALCL